MAYDKTFPYTLKYKGSSYVIDKSVEVGGTFTTIQKDSGTVYKFNDTTNLTPAYIEFLDNTTGVVGSVTASGTIDLDTVPEDLFIVHEGELDWGKQNLQNFLHILEKLDTVRQNAQIIKSPIFWMGL